MHRLRTMVSVALILCFCLIGCSSKKTDIFSETPPSSPTVQEQAADSAELEDIPSQEDVSGEWADSSIQETPADTEKYPEESEPELSGTIEKQSSLQMMPDEKEKVDIDLTAFSPNMLYAEVYNMGISPEDYIGKTIKITGAFAHFQDLDENGIPISDEVSLVCIVSDAMACCARGVEFIPAEGSSFTDNYPEDGSEITVTGVCDIFVDETGFFTTIELDNASIERVE